jgi:hypothetical protein
MTGEAPEGRPGVSICLECAEACADALRTETKLSEARASEPPGRPLASPPPTGLGEVQPWTAFTLDGESWQWRAVRSLGTSMNRSTRLSVRRKGSDTVLTMELFDSAPPSAAHATFAAAWLPGVFDAARRAPAQDDIATELLVPWTPLATLDDADVEWCAERSDRLQGRAELWVHARRLGEAGESHLRLPPSTVPTVDDAVMAATAASSERTRVDLELDELVDQYFSASKS